VFLWRLSQAMRICLAQSGEFRTVEARISSGQGWLLTRESVLAEG
jgi:hypothetical protein